MVDHLQRFVRPRRSCGGQPDARQSELQRPSVNEMTVTDLDTIFRTMRAVCHSLVPRLDAPVAVNCKLIVARGVMQRALTRDEPSDHHRRTS